MWKGLLVLLPWMRVSPSGILNSRCFLLCERRRVRTRARGCLRLTVPCGMRRWAPVSLEVSTPVPLEVSTPTNAVCSTQSDDDAWREHWVRQLRLARQTELQPLTALPMGCNGLRRKLRSPVLRVEFVMWWGSASSHLRGLMMARRLSKVFGANASVEAVSGFEFAQRATPVDFCICVKWCVDPAPQHCRARGGLAVLDLLDNEDEWRRALRNESAVVRRAALKRAD